MQSVIQGRRCGWNA